MLNEQAEQYNRNLLDSHIALEYVKSRGINDILIEEGIVGYCPTTSKPNFTLLKGRITVPLTNVYGDVLAFAGRQIPNLEERTIQSLFEYYKHDPAKAELRIKKWKKSKWINELNYQRNKHLFNLSRARQSIMEKGYVVLVEGYFDSLILYSLGLKNVATLSGVSISDYQCSLIARYCSNVVLLLDADKAGEKAVDSIKPKLEGFDFFVSVVKLPKGFDPDDFVLKYDIKKLERYLDALIDKKTERAQIRI